MYEALLPNAVHWVKVLWSLNAYFLSFWWTSFFKCLKSLDWSCRGSITKDHQNTNSIQKLENFLITNSPVFLDTLLSLDCPRLFMLDAAHCLLLYVLASQLEWTEFLGKYIPRNCERTTFFSCGFEIRTLSIDCQELGTQWRLLGLKQHALFHVIQYVTIISNKPTRSAWYWFKYLNPVMYFCESYV